MARKISFEVQPEEKPVAEPQLLRPSAPPSKAPSLSGMARSLQAAAAASIREIDTRLIDGSDFQDRLELDPEEINDLALSIQSQGQLIPILVSPAEGGRFRIVYGRRRLAALRQIGLPAKALVRDLDEDQAILAQGQENTFRRDLSWIEKAVFARQLIEAGKSDELICDTLNIDQKARRSGEKLTGLSRMKQVTAKLPPALIEIIGAAPKTGRDRWYDFAQSFEKLAVPAGNLAELIDTLAAAKVGGSESDARFTMADDWLRQMQKRSVKSPALLVEAQSAEGQVRANAKSATITIHAKAAPALHQWIAENPELALAALVSASKAQKPQTE